MTHTATHRRNHPTGRRRVPAATALAVAAAVALGACSGDTGDEPTTTPSPRSTTSSSSNTSPSPSPTTSAPAPVAASSATAAPDAPSTTALPANVVGTGGPCHMLGEVAQAEDGSPLFCTDDPTAGPLWLPAGGADAGIGQAVPDGPCAQEGIAVRGPGDTILTCTLVGGGDVPAGLYWR